MKNLTAFIYAWALVVVGAITRGIVATVLWKWFMVPFGLPALGIAWAIGVGYTGNFLLGINNDVKVESKEEDIFVTMIVATVKVAFIQGFTLLFGYIVHSFM